MACKISGAICSCKPPFINISSDCVFASFTKLRITCLGADQQSEEVAEGPVLLRRRNSESRPNALQTQKWNLNPSWKMRWGKPPVAISFAFEVVRMFVPVRIGALLVGLTGTV
jgi:hypothetical protein